MMRLSAWPGDSNMRLVRRQQETAMRAVVVKNEADLGQYIPDLNIIETHGLSCVIVCLASPTKGRLGLFPLGDRSNVGCRLGCDAKPTNGQADMKTCLQSLSSRQKCCLHVQILGRPADSLEYPVTL